MQSKYFQSLPDIAKSAAVAANVIVLAYLVVFATACPSWQMLSAVAFEIAVFVAVLGYRKWRSRTVSAKRVNEALQYIETRSKVVYFGRRAIAATSMIVFAIACLYMTADLTALILARCSFSNQAERIYFRIAPPAVLRIDPALSWEMLTGAYIESGQYQKAEGNEFALMDLRKSLFGEKHEKIASLLANIGDLYRKAGMGEKAELYYRRSIQMTKELHLPQGWGSPATKLGALLRDENRFLQSQIALDDALAIRTMIFGNNSVKVAETLTEYAELLRREGDASGAAEVDTRVARIYHDNGQAGTDGMNLTPYAVLLVSVLFFWQREKLLVKLAEFFRRNEAEQHS